MLRLLVLILILANGAYFAWSEGLLRAYGFAPAQQREPQRMAQQIKPEALRVLSAGELKQIEAQIQAELTPKECLQAGPFDDAQTAALRVALEASLPPGSWTLDSVVEPAHWIVYMGKFANAEALNKKRNELSSLNLAPQGVNNSTLEPGLSLGGFDTQEAAANELARLHLRGIRTAKVVQERQEGRSGKLKLPSVTEALKPRLNAIRPAMAGKDFKRCN
jgi:hypothetical protein